MPEGFTVGFFIDCGVDITETTNHALLRMQFRLQTAIPIPPKSFRPGPPETVAILLRQQDAENLVEMLARVLDELKHPTPDG